VGDRESSLSQAAGGRRLLRVGHRRNRRVVVAALVVAAAILAGAAAARPTVATPAHWSAYGGTSDVANVAVHATLDAGDARRLALRWTRKLDGSVVAQPLYLAGVRAGARRALVIVVTGGNSVFALDAATGAVAWRRRLGDVVQTVCGGHAGIASTPAADPARGILYVIGSRGQLHALDVATGSELRGWPLRLVQGTDVEYVWGALRVSGPRIYVPVASHCDQPRPNGVRADGRLIAVDRLTRRVERTLDVVPGPGNMGGLWGWGGVSVDADRTVYAGTANSYLVADGNLIEDAGLAERVLRLSADLRRVLGSAAQTYKSEANAGDQGFGSTPLLFRPPGCPPLAAAHSKNGSLYVWERGARFPQTVFSVRIGPSTDNDSLLAQPTWFAQTRTLVVGQGLSESDGVRGPIGFRVDTRCTFTRTWQTNIGGGPIAQPLAVGRLAIVNAVAIGKLAVIDTATGGIVRLLSTGTSYAPPIAVGRTMFAAAADGTVRAYAPPG
jgi:hypothetical protein